MPRGYLDEMVPVNSGILGQYISPVGPFREPIYAMVDNDTVAATPVPTRTRSSKPKKKKSNKPKNDGIIRNHDSVWDYKFENGKLLTRRKKGNGNWIDISNNEKAVNKLESFTGRRISTTKNQNQNTTKQTSTSVTQPQQQSSTNTNRSTTKQVTQNQVSEPSINNAYELPGITVTAKVNNTKGKNKPLLSQEDLDTNGWHWASNWNDKATFDNGYGLNLGLSAVEKTKAGDKILVDSNGAIVPTSEVHRYINRGRIPLYISDYDAQFYQPQAYNNIKKDVRRAEDRRRNREFDRQRNTALATMFGLPALGVSVAAAPAATLLALGGSELVGAGFEGAWKHATGNTWAQSLGANDPTGEFYADMLQPGRAVGGFLGGYAANATQPTRQAAVDAIGARLPKPNVKGARLSLAMNKALNNKKLNAQDKRILKESVPYLFEPARKTPMSIAYPLNYGRYNYMNPALSETMTAGPYAIPNYTNGVPFGIPIPRNLWGEMKWLPGDPLNRASRVPYLNIQ